MYKSGLSTPCVDPTSKLSEDIKAAAAKAGFAVPFITDEAKFAMGVRERMEAEFRAKYNLDQNSNPNGSAGGVAPQVK